MTIQILIFIIVCDFIFNLLEGNAYNFYLVCSVCSLVISLVCGVTCIELLQMYKKIPDSFHGYTC